jgi:hypothetical protein
LQGHETTQLQLSARVAVMCHRGVGFCDVACDGATVTKTMALETTPTNAEVMTPNVRIEGGLSSKLER